MKRRYELTVIFSSELPSADLTKTIKKLETQVKKSEGKIVKTDEWGKRTFTYPIAKQTEGVYRHYVVEISGDALGKLSHEFKMMEGILRYMFVREGA